MTVTFEMYDERDILLERFVVDGVDATAGRASVALFISYNENGGL